MSRFLAFTFSVAMLALPAAAQRGGRSGGLGGTPASTVTARSHPLGGVIAHPPAMVGGGFHGGGFRNDGFHNDGRRRSVVGYPYGYAYYVPGYYDYNDSSSYFDPSYAPPAPSSAAYYAPPPQQQSQQPVIINQYFGAQGPQDTGPQAVNDPPHPGDPIGTPSNYYLIAYKNHSVYPALAYWVEDKTLHYVTTQNTHNQASLDLIDLTLTKSLNQTNDVPFSIPGQ